MSRCVPHAGKSAEVYGPWPAAAEEGFPPAGAVVGGPARFLVLGTFPSIRSQSRQEYYGHERNHFWPLLFSFAAESGLLPLPAEPGQSMWHAGASLAAVSAYEAKIGLAARLQVILWDMVKSCRRTTSADDALEIVALNDIAALLQAHPEIERIGLNGTRASTLFLKNVVYGCDFRQAREALSGVGGRVVLAIAGKTRAIYRLPSTSPVPTPQYRTIEDKWALWQRFFY
ncbi:MAG: uracil-DNA glycosylase family protein [Rectinema sp.]|jgi:G:T/U-mismatch repair DNA glycosylase|uniref:Uracil-DNA glycosylase-like domain-containing protein n=1 Tax=uncultured spirochete TaxID=156406 RepID=A0A3P3XU61_9SPIR|nr:conserved hypothetical protein [uncultured spirochete]